MSQQELLKTVIQVLDGVGIPYMLTGSIVSSLQGEPRSTHDIDVVVEIHKSRTAGLIHAFPPDRFYLDGESIYEAIDRQSMFSMVDLETGGKVDFWILTGEAFDRSRFNRRCEESFGELRLRVSSPEDTILVKLKWAKLSGGSEKQFTDALRIYEVQFDKLDLDYLEEWVKKLGVESLWRRLKEEAETD